MHFYALTIYMNNNEYVYIHRFIYSLKKMEKFDEEKISKNKNDLLVHIVCI